MKIGEQEKEALIEFQAITGNDCHSLEKENANAGKKMISKDFFKETVKCLGDSRDVFVALFLNIEEFICAIYNAKNKTVNPTRAEEFTEKYSNENKIIVSYITSSCKMCKLCAKLWKTCLHCDFTLPTQHSRLWFVRQ